MSATVLPPVFGPVMTTPFIPSPIQKSSGTAFSRESSGCYTLSSLVDDFSGELRRSAKTMEALDVVFACGRLSIQMEAAPPQLTSERRLHIRAGRH